jgi:hypothetical protein
LRLICLSFLLLAATDRASAQFSLNTIGRNAELAVPLPIVVPGSIDARVVNPTEARQLRRALWRDRNSVDFKVSLTGVANRFSKSWTTNNENSVSGELVAYYYHTRTRNRFSWQFKFDGIYGVNFIDEAWFKNQDMLKLYYLGSWKMRQDKIMRQWAYSFSASFSSQFAEGRASRTDRTVWSNFMAPGMLNAGVGFTFTSPDPKLPFIVTLDPVSGNGLFVLDDRIDDDRRKKLGISLPDDAVVGGHNYVSHRYKFEGGSNINVAFNRTFAFGRGGNFTLQYNTTLSSFYGWITQVGRHSAPGGSGSGGAVEAIMPTMSWTNVVSINPWRFVTLEFRTTALYDRSQVDKLQMQYYLRVGLTYRYKNR